MTDILEWTDAGRAALAAELARAPRSLHAAPQAELCATIDALVMRFAPCWKRGIAKSDDRGRAAIAFASGAWKLDGIAIDQAAGMASLLGARSDDDGGAFAELVVRAHGIDVALRMLVAMWSLITDYDDPDYPESEDRLAIWLRAIADTDGSAQDVSVSHAKGDVAGYLRARYRAANASDQAAATRAAHALWESASPQARTALAVAVQDRELAETVIRELIAAGRPMPTPRFAWSALPELVREPALLAQLAAAGHLPFTYAWLEAIGPQAVPLYAATIDSRATTVQLRKRMIEQLVNVRGPGAAAILARYAGNAHYRPLIRGYFARHPELS